MNHKTFNKIPLGTLALLGITYTLLGWYLSIYHIIWLIGAFIIAVIVAIVGNSSYWLEWLVKSISRELATVLIVSLAISILVALATSWSILLSLILLPLATVLLAEVEMGSAGFSKLNTFLMLTILTGLGLGVGEIIDLLFFHSIRF